MNLAILYWVLIGLMLVGVLGATLPGLPGTSLILMAMAVWCNAIYCSLFPVAFLNQFFFQPK
ncbi:hypothetical protein [Moorena sp. SIOASIH]|uniref:hypothetical protein n=1 Tax=Moorena sp. SIOASIH TaxID=2607817 RepID=UPI0025F9F7B1|nr:hypothetical protein [Moorena sp. SIOASIH]